MQKLGPYYIGQISLYSLRGWILDSGLTEADTLALHPTNLEKVGEEYRVLYNEAMPDPYFLLGVLLDEAREIDVPENRVVILQNDERTDKPVVRPKDIAPIDDGRPVFRCDRCGSIVNEAGELLEGRERQYAIYLLRMRGDQGTRHVWGKCCNHFYE